MAVGRAERFFLVLGEVQKRKHSTRFQDAGRFLEGKARVGCMVEHLAHQDEVCVVGRKARLRHVGDFRHHVFDALLVQNLLESADDFRVIVEGRHVLATAGEHQREVSAFATTDVHGVFEWHHELAEQADLRFEASAGLVELMDLSLGLVGAFFERLCGAALENVLVLQFVVGFADNLQQAAAHVKFFAQAVISLDAVAAVFHEPALRKLCQVAACITLVDVQNVLDFVDCKFGLVQEEQNLEAHFVGNGSKKFHVRDNRFSVLV